MGQQMRDWLPAPTHRGLRQKGRAGKMAPWLRGPWTGELGGLGDRTDCVLRRSEFVMLHELGLTCHLAVFDGKKRNTA